MRLLILLMLCTCISFIHCKNNVKTLTESMGQEVIEIGAPLKELPLGLEEEPSAENDDDVKQKITSNTVPPFTKKEAKKTTILIDMRKKVKDIEKIDGMNQDDEEARIEKELAEIYKDTADYKSDSAEEKEEKEEKEVITQATTEPTSALKVEEDTSVEQFEKPIARQRTNFKFQPDTTDKADIERFRTSIDDISCNSRQKLSGDKTSGSKAASDSINHGFTLISVILCCIFVCI